MKAICVLLLLLFLPCCTLISKMETLVDDAKATYEEAKTAKEEATVILQKAKAEADINKDGKTSLSEWLTWILGGGLTALLGALKIASLQKQTNELYDATHAPIAATTAAK